MSEHTIELLGGYVDEKGNAHKSVTFGKRLTGKELFAIDEDPMGQLQTQYSDLLIRASITRFGLLSMPVPLSVLLALDFIDREDLSDGYNKFMAAGLEGRVAEFRADDEVRLSFGYESSGLVFDVVKFGTRLTGMDSVEADRRKLIGVRRECFMVGKQIVKLSQSDGTSVLDGALELQQFDRLDAHDIATLRTASELWRQSFRRNGVGLPAGRSAKRADTRN
jgi:hypothetical protein